MGRAFPGWVNSLRLLFLSLFLLSAGTASAHLFDLGFLSVDEDERWYAERLQTDPEIVASPMGARPSDAWDIRGVGDTAWTKSGSPGNRSSIPETPAFGTALDQLDPTGNFLRGHFSFLNWESVIGEACDSIREQVDFYFLSHPDSIRQAFQRGFNLISVSNNHAQDCNLGRTAESLTARRGPEMSAEALQAISASESSPLLWAGVNAPGESDPYQARVETFEIDGRRVRVALGAISVLSWAIPGVATVNYNEPDEAIRKYTRLLESLSTADADLRILSVHTQDASGHRRKEAAGFRLLKKIGEDFILKYRGDVVFGEGPHTWGGVRVIPREDGHRGVIFTSLGNFIHQGLGSNPDNYVARALFDRNSLQLTEVQVVPFSNHKTRVNFYSPSARPIAPMSNFEWKAFESPLGGKQVSGFSARFR